ncbi:hypothetical protein FQA39_LY00199 [Lamprigera yunnana]|nr:hypothetical protein FQA39_LY00199 [Lamprigera yunnana]
MINLPIPRIEGYDVVEKIGSGSFSVVFKANTKTTPRTVVAVKCIHKRYQKKTFADNVVREITMLKELNHNYIVKLIDFVTDINYICIITEYCDVGDLAYFIKSKQRLSETMVKVFMQQLMFALKFLQGYDICHLDLKPQNLLLCSKPFLTLKIADFGSSQIISPQNVEQVRYVGSILYMAPEKLLCQEFDARVDLWSVGMIMYECLFGRSPFISLNLKQIIEVMHKKAPIELPSNVGITAACKNLLEGLLKYQPEERITFNEFFTHDFLDLAHVPNSENYSFVFTLLADAVALDSKQQYSQSLPKYIEAIKFLENFQVIVTNPNSKAILYQRLQQYKMWVATLTGIVNGHSATSALSLPYKDCFEILREISTNTPNLTTGLDMGSIGELYYNDGNKQLAFDNLSSALSLLLPALGREPPGTRKDLLHIQVQKWLTVAECLNQQLK